MATVRYLVKDVETSISFYERLGFTVAERMGPPFAMMSLGDLTLWVSGPASSAARTLSDGSVPEPGGWNRLVIEVPDIQGTMDTLRKSGVRFRSEPVTGPGGTQVLVEDPSGNLVEIFEARRG